MDRAPLCFGLVTQRGPCRFPVLSSGRSAFLSRPHILFPRFRSVTITRMYHPPWRGRRTVRRRCHGRGPLPRLPSITDSQAARIVDRRTPITAPPLQFSSNLKRVLTLAGCFFASFSVMTLNPPSALALWRISWRTFRAARGGVRARGGGRGVGVFSAPHTLLPLLGWAALAGRPVVLRKRRRN